MPEPLRPTRAIVSPGSNVEIDVAQHPAAGSRVGEADVLKVIRPATAALRTGRWPRAIGHFAGLFQQVEHPVEAGEVVLELGDAGGQHGHRFQQHGQVHQEHHQVAQREPALKDLIPAVEQEGDRGHRQHELPEQLDDPRQPPDMKLEPAHEVVLAHEPGRLALLAAEGADHAHAAEDLGGLAVDLLALLADVAEERPDSPVPEQVGVIDSGYQAERAEQEPPVHPGQHDKAAEELNDGLPGVIEHAEDELADAAGILAQQAGGTARLELVDPVQGKPHRVFVDLAPDRDLHALGGPRRQPAAPEPDRTCPGS